MSDIKKTVEIVYEANTSSAESGLDTIQKKNEKFVKNVEKSEKSAVAAQKSAVSTANQAHTVNLRRTRLDDQATRKRTVDARKVRKEETQHSKQQTQALKQQAQLTSQITRSQQQAINQQIQAPGKMQRVLQRLMGKGGSGGGPGGGGSGVGGFGASGSARRGGGGGGGLGIGSFARGAGGLAAGAGLAALGALYGWVSGEVSEGLDKYREFDRARSSLAGMNFGNILSSGAVDQSKRAGYSKIDTMRHASLIARQTGSMDSTVLAQRLSRSGAGLGVEELGSFMGTLTRSGNRMDGRGTQVMFQAMRNAVSSGLDKSRTGEHLDALSSVIQDVGNRTTGPVDASGISALLGAFGKLGGSAFQGQRGVSILSTLDQNIRGMGEIGRGDASQAAALQALGYGMPGSGVSLMDGLRQLQRGLFTNPEQGVDTLSKFLDSTGRNLGAGSDQERWFLQDSIMKGLNLDQVDSLTNLARSGNRNALKEELEKMRREQQPLQSIDEILRGGILAELQESARLDNRSVDIGGTLVDEVRGLRQQWQAMTDGLLTTLVGFVEKIMQLLVRVAEWFNVDVGDIKKTIKTPEAPVPIVSMSPGPIRDALTIQPGTGGIGLQSAEPGWMAAQGVAPSPAATIPDLNAPPPPAARPAAPGSRRRTGTTTGTTTGTSAVPVNIDRDTHQLPPGATRVFRVPEGMEDIWSDDRDVPTVRVDLRRGGQPNDDSPVVINLTRSPAGRRGRGSH